MYNIVFVILHYKALEDTIECVESILKLKNKYKIIIVDNGSSNGSGIMLMEKYKDISCIKVLLLNNNIGFAKGNNIGYEYARIHYNANFIIVLNNDTIILDNDFIDKIIYIYNETKYSLLGPDILSMDDDSRSNPQSYRHRGISCNNIIWHVCRMIIVHILVTIAELCGYKNMIKTLKRIKDKIENNPRTDETRLYNVQLFGAFLIYSPLWIQHFKYAFYPETYMYMEEEFLYYLCMKNNLKIVYDRSIKIYHKGEASTGIIMSTDYKKRIFRIKHSIESAKILYKLMRHDKKERSL